MGLFYYFLHCVHTENQLEICNILAISMKNVNSLGSILHRSTNGSITRRRNLRKLKKVNTSLRQNDTGHYSMYCIVKNNTIDLKVETSCQL
jgi:hypothetical protein